MNLNLSGGNASEGASQFLLVEAERYRYLAQRTADEHMAALWRRIVAEYEDLARRHAVHFAQEVSAPVSRLPDSPQDTA
jgi:hypothetical protein